MQFSLFGSGLSRLSIQKAHTVPGNAIYSIFVISLILKKEVLYQLLSIRNAFLFFLFIINPAFSQNNYYVSPQGSDGNPGSLQSPFKTIQKAADIMTAGDTCFIRKGEYRETVTPVNSGSKDSYLVFTAFNNERVVIMGSNPVINWTPYKNGIYKTFVPDTVTQLFANKKRAFPASYPDYRNGGMYSTSSWASVNAHANGDAFFSGMNKPENYWKGAYCKILTGHKWVAHVGIISSSDGDMVHCDERSSPWNNYNPGVYLGDGMGYIMKHLHALDSENEWHWQNDTLYFFPPHNSDIDTMKIEARTRQYGFNCESKSYIEIKNIHFLWASVNFGSAHGCVLDGGSVWFPEPFFYYENSWVRDQGGQENHSIDHWAGKGIHVSGSLNTIKNCYVAYSWGDGISIGGSKNIVENCLVENCDWSATDAGCISATGYGHQIDRNTLHTAARSILIHRFCDSTNIKYNHLYNCGLMTDDLGLTYSYHTNGRGSEIAYNWVHDNHASGTASGIYLDNYDTNYIIHHNVVWNCTYALHTNKPAVNHKIYNNTVWNCAHAQWTWGPSGTQIVNQKVINNLSDKAWNVGTFFQTNLTVADPRFVDAENGDFSLLDDSPAIDFGTEIPNITDGYTGASPDAGAYEYGGDKWLAGSHINIPDLSDIIIIPDEAEQGLIAYYPFNGNAQDESGNGYHASEIMGASLCEDKDGNPNSAYSFDGIDDRILIPFIGVNLAHDFSITYWFQANDLSTRQWIFGNRHKANGNEGNGIESDIFEGHIRIFWPAQEASAYAITNNDWQFFTFTKNGNIYSLYHNGKLIESNTNSGYPANNNPWRIAAQYNLNGWGAHFNGKIDEIRIYDRSLSADEVNNLYLGNTIGAIDTESDSDQIRIFPNPSSQIFSVSHSSAVSRIDVYDNLGKRIIVNNRLDKVDLSDNPKGIYLLVLYDKNNRFLTSKKIVKD